MLPCLAVLCHWRLARRTRQHGRPPVHTCPTSSMSVNARHTLQLCSAALLYFVTGTWHVGPTSVVAGHQSLWNRTCLTSTTSVNARHSTLQLCSVLSPDHRSCARSGEVSTVMGVRTGKPRAVGPGYLDLCWVEAFDALPRMMPHRSRHPGSKKGRSRRHRAGSDSGQ